MAPIPGTPRRASAPRARKSATRPRSGSGKRAGSPTPASKSEPPQKKRRYVPGGPGGGGRYVDEDGNEEPVGGTGPGGYNYVGPRGRVGQENAKKGITPVVYQRRDRSTRTRTVLPRSQQPPMRFNSSAQAAAAVVQNDGYKPREERSWEEFHPDLDIDAKLQLFAASDVDALPPAVPETPAAPLSANGSINGVHGALTPTSTRALTPNGTANGSVMLPGTPPTKRRPGRPPRDPVAFYAARAASHSLVPTSNGMTPATGRIAPLQNYSAKERLTLPQPSYRKVDALAKFEDKAAGQVKYVEKSMANVGYQETDIFIRPKYVLIKHRDSYLDEEIDLPVKSNENVTGATAGSVGRVEYDMDEQDDKWLEGFNASQRKAAGIEPISREMFEITITKIEKEWHALEKRIPKPNPKPPQTHRPRSSSAAAVNGEPQAGEEQDSKCTICDDGDCENTNAIVFCDGCDLAVHQECYGVPFIPEGQWLCRKCQLIGRGIPTCIFCPNTDGGFKQTNSSRWAHLLCAMWIPEVSLGNHTFMEPVMDVEKVPKTRWKLTCYICQQRMGACIQCGNKMCYQAFHVTCARRARLFLKMKNSQGVLAEIDGSTQLKAFCDKHCPQDYAKENDVVSATREARNFYKRTMKGRLWADSQASALALAATHQNAITEHPPNESESTGARLALSLGSAKKKGEIQNLKSIWKLPSGAPVIPAVVYDAIEASLQRFMIRKRRDWVAAACRYWTLKREARRGAALLKRLQLQMETFSSMEITRRNFASMGEAGRARLQKRIEFAKMLIRDVERLKELSADVVQRETEKLQSAIVERDHIDMVHFPIAKLLPPIVEKALTLDIRKVFTLGLLQVSKQVDARYYVETMTLAEDLAVIFKDGIEAVRENMPGELTVSCEEYNASLKQAIHEAKDRKKLAKRIVKAIQTQLEAAIRAEADLLQKSPEQMVADMEAVLEGCIDVSPEALLGPPKQDTVVEQEAIDHFMEGVEVAADDNADIHQQITVEAEAANIAAAQSEDVDMLDKDAPGEEVDDGDVLTPIVSVSDEVAEANSTRVTAQLKSANGTPISGTPPGSNGYSITSPISHQPPQPPTPPVSNPSSGSTVSQDVGSTSVSQPAEPSSGNFLTDGGKPWYLKYYDPETRTFEEPQWAARALSEEELSEMDDDELNDLGVWMEIDGVDGDGQVQGEGVGAGEAEAEVGKAKPLKKAKARRRWRGFR